MEQFHGTTILTVRRGDRVVVGGDGQVTLGSTVMKGNATKVRKLYNDSVIAGFAGATADAFTLLERFEAELERYSGQLKRAAVELAKLWRTERALQKLEAMMIVVDKDSSLLISGTGDVLDARDDLIAIGSGGPYAQAAARALYDNTELDARSIVAKSLEIAGGICIYTNTSLTVEELPSTGPTA